MKYFTEKDCGNKWCPWDHNGGEWLTQQSVLKISKAKHSTEKWTLENI